MAQVSNDLNAKLLQEDAKQGALSPTVALQANAMAQTKAREVLAEGAQEAELPGIQRAIQEVEAVSSNMADAGFSQLSFFVGVVNVGLTGFVLGRFPAYIWVLYVLKCLVYIPAWFIEVTRRQNGSLYILDFCWVSNILMGSYMLVNLFAGHLLPAFVQRWGFLWFYATAMGPLCWAVLVLQNGLVFHSIERSANLFIHFTPSVVAWTLRWSPEEVTAVWPGRFTDASLEQATVGEVYTAGITMYFFWLFFYAAWLLTIGIHAPKKGYRTVFDGFYTGNNLGPKITKLTGLKSLRSHVVVFLSVHALACSITFLWAMLCYKFWVVHTAFLVMLFLAISWMGAGFYMHIFTEVYSKALNKLIPKSDV